MRRTALAAARKTAGYTQEGLAEDLHIDRSTVVRWERGAQAPLPYIRPKLGRLLGQSQEQLRALIDDGLGSGGVAATPVQARSAENQLDSAFEWLDEHARWEPGTSRRKVAQSAAASGSGHLVDHVTRRARVDRERTAAALRDYYGDGAREGGLYRAQCDGHRVATTVATRPSWLDLSWPLTPRCDQLSLASSAPDVAPRMDQTLADCAVERLVEAQATDTRIINAPAYRLLDVDIGTHGVAGTLALVPFAAYALTADLLERELLDAISVGQPTRPGWLPVRDRYLPDLPTVLDIGNRLCVGGALALCAIARPADAGRAHPDYLLLVQERSGQVVNVTGQLSVIPKAFHAPLNDYRAETQLRTTVLREMEEELFGRHEVDSTIGNLRAGAPMHPHRLSEPMQWLCKEPDRMRMECTGFGLNVVSGNYEFASLITIDDEEFWERYGGHLEANWESTGLRQYSSLDRELITTFATGTLWSNEGLFAFLQGIRRLATLGGTRVDLPNVELGV